MDRRPVIGRRAGPGDQKLNWSMFFASNTVGLPRVITPSLPIVYSVEPALKVSPSLPVICPEDSARAVRAARSPSLAGSHSSKPSTVPFLTYLRMSLGVPRPVSLTLPLYLEPDRYWAAALMPTVGGEMIPFRFGYSWSRPCVCWKDCWASSLP